MNEQLIRLTTISLGFLWVFTGITSLFFAKDIGYAVLEKAGIEDGLADLAILVGSLLDIAIGFWVLSDLKFRLCGLIQLIVILVYSVILVFVDPSFLFHPFGPVTKNLPIMVLIYVAYLRRS